MRAVMEQLCVPKCAPKIETRYEPAASPEPGCDTMTCGLTVYRVNGLPIIWVVRWNAWAGIDSRKSPLAESSH